MTPRKSVIEKHILNNLERLDTLHANSKSNSEAIFYSKMVLLELCGWIEDTMDRIIIVHTRKKLKIPSNKKMLESQIIGTNYGFHYENHFRQMLIKSFGIIIVEKLESKLDQSKFHILKSNLGDLKKQRDEHAHTHIAGATKMIFAPSSTKAYFANVSNGLKDIDLKLSSLL